MAFNIIAETDKRLDFSSVHKAVYQEDLPFDFFSMPDLGIDGGDAIGICVPLNNANEESWGLLKPILEKLNSTFNCHVYDLYGGQKLGDSNIETFRKNLLMK